MGAHPAGHALALPSVVPQSVGYQPTAPVPQGPPPPPPPPPHHGAAADVVMGTAAPVTMASDSAPRQLLPQEQQALSSSISQLQACRKQIAANPAMTTLVSQIDQQIAEAKRTITSSRPLEHQIKTCEAFIRRRIERVLICDKTIQALQMERMTLNREAAVARKQLKCLQIQKLQETQSLRAPAPQTMYSNLIKELAGIDHPAVQQAVLKYADALEPVFYELSD